MGAVEITLFGFIVVTGLVAASGALILHIRNLRRREEDTALR